MELFYSLLEPLSLKAWDQMGSVCFMLVALYLNLFTHWAGVPSKVA